MVGDELQSNRQVTVVVVDGDTDSRMTSEIERMGVPVYRWGDPPFEAIEFESGRGCRRSGQDIDRFEHRAHAVAQHALVMAATTTDAAAITSACCATA